MPRASSVSACTTRSCAPGSAAFTASTSRSTTNRFSTSQTPSRSGPRRLFMLAMTEASWWILRSRRPGVQPAMSLRDGAEHLVGASAQRDRVLLVEEVLEVPPGDVVGRRQCDLPLTPALQACHGIAAVSGKTSRSAFAQAKHGGPCLDALCAE